jgi:hypothetical protein
LIATVSQQRWRAKQLGLQDSVVEHGTVYASADAAMASAGVRSSHVGIDGPRLRSQSTRRVGGTRNMVETSLDIWAQPEIGSALPHFTASGSKVGNRAAGCGGGRHA